MLVAVLVVAVIVRFAPRHSAKPASAAAAKSKAKAGAAGRAKANPEPGRGRLVGGRFRGRRGPAAAPPARPVLRHLRSACRPAHAERHDVDPFGRGGFPTLTAPCPKPRVANGGSSTGILPVLPKHRLEACATDAAAPSNADLSGIRPARRGARLQGAASHRRATAVTGLRHVPNRAEKRRSVRSDGRSAASSDARPRPAARAFGRCHAGSPPPCRLPITSAVVTRISTPRGPAPSADRRTATDASAASRPTRRRRPASPRISRRPKLYGGGGRNAVHRRPL